MRFTRSVAEKHTERAVGLEPFEAIYAGIAGHDHELADLSADGFAERPSWIARPATTLQS